MEEKCEEFKKVMEVKKAIKSSRKEQEERS